MKFSLFDVMEKGAYLRWRLEEAGHVHVPVEEAELMLLDCDWAFAPGRRELIDTAVSHGVKVATYPHGGQPTFFVYDGLTNGHPGVGLRLEHGSRAAELADTFGSTSMQSFGWLYSPTAPFEPVESPYRILFAPQHPNMEALMTGEGPDKGPRLNQAVYRDLLDLGYDLTVSVVGPLWRNGLWRHPRTRFIQNPEMRFTQAYQLVQQADVVVAAGTLAAAAVAAGKPTVFLEEHDCCDFIRGEYRQSDHADEYRMQLRYPLVAGDGPLEDLIAVACQGSKAVEMWRDWWVGDDGTGEAVRALEHLLGESSRRDVTIGGVTARATGVA